MLRRCQVGLLASLPAYMQEPLRACRGGRDAKADLEALCVYAAAGRGINYMEAQCISIDVKSKTVRLAGSGHLWWNWRHCLQLCYLASCITMG